MGSISRQAASKADEQAMSSMLEDWQGSPNKQAPHSPPRIGDLLGLGTGADTDTASNDSGLRSVLLAKAVEYEIIPRLMLAHRVPKECADHVVTSNQRVTPEDVALFAELVLHEDDGVVRDCVISLRDRGVPIEAIFLDLLAPVARHLGEMWDRDLCTFTEVTMGLGRLQKVLRENSMAFGPPRTSQEPEEMRRILLMPCPGEHHTFGLSLVAEFFHRAGWDVVTSFLTTDAAAVMVKQDRYDVVGFSLGIATGATRLTATIKLVREVSLNTRVAVICGGPAFDAQPEISAQVGADAIIANGRQAPYQAEKLVLSNRLRI
jgi:methanogenic corrinoid protein MtbC1